MPLRGSRRLFLSQCVAFSILPSLHLRRRNKTRQQQKSWQNRFEGFRPESVLITSDGNYIFVGGSAEEHTYDDGPMTAYDARVVEINESGDVQWSETYYDQKVRERGRISNMDFNFYFDDIVRSPAGGYLCIGQYNDTNYGYRIGWVVKIGSSGNHEWDSYFGPEQADSVRDVFGDAFLRTGFPTEDGYLVVGGSIPADANVGDRTNGLMIKISEDGEKGNAWVNQDVVSFSSLVDWDANTVLLSGRSSSSSERGKILRYELPLDDGRPQGWISISSPIAFLIRSTDGVLAFGSTNDAGGVVKLNTDLDPEWDRLYSPWEHDIAFSDAIATPNGWLLVGLSRQLGRGWVIKIDEEGEKQYEEIYEDIVGDFKTGVRTSDNSYLLAGDDGEFDGEGWIVKIGGDGSPETRNEIVIRSTDRERAFYGFTVAGDIEYGERANPEETADYPDRIEENIARGAVARNGVDDFHFSGDLLDLRVKGPAEISVNGETITPAEITDEPLSHAAMIESTGQERAFYEFTVDGSLQYGENANPVEAEHPDRIRGRTASGSVANRGVDNFDFAGELVDLRIDGPAKVLVDGREIDPETVKSV